MSDKVNSDIYVLGNQVTQWDLGNARERQCQTTKISTSMFWVTR